MNLADQEMKTGIVKWFDTRRGFGFVYGDNGQDVFVHFSVIEGEGFRKLHEGEQVDYEAIQRPNGLFATKVRRKFQP
jgi:CspA family cold shock protein